VTTRDLEFRAESVDRDYARLAGAIRIAPDRIVRVRQVHGREVCATPRGAPVPAPGTTDADAVVVTSPGVVASVRIADCVPVLIADRGHRVVAAVHAGWRGTAAGVSAAAVRAIRERGVPTEDLVALIGPSIGPCCYQVDGRVFDSFAAAWPGAGSWFVDDGPGRWRLDLWRANQDQLVAEGVPTAAIESAGLCTVHHPDDWFSHRRDGERAGRMVAAVWLPPDS
jgi:YfiH family protein